MLSSMVSRLVILAFGTLYPAFASYKAVRTRDMAAYVRWMMYWVVFALFTCVETITDMLLAWWLPWYYELKVLLVVWLLSPATRGSSLLYSRCVHPWLERHEAQIERCVARASRRGCSAVMQLGVRGVNIASQIILQTAIRGGDGLVSQLQRSYSANDVTDLAANGNLRRLRICDVIEEASADEEPGAVRCRRRRRSVGRRRARPVSETSAPPADSVEDAAGSQAKSAPASAAGRPARGAGRARSAGTRSQARQDGATHGSVPTRRSRRTAAVRSRSPPQ